MLPLYESKKYLGIVSSAAKLKWNGHLIQLTWTFPYFFICGFPKNIINLHNICNVTVLKATITEMILAITLEECVHFSNKFARHV